MFVSYYEFYEMLPALNKIKGIHPGALLKRELNIRVLKGSELADSIGEHRQTISAILNKKRDMNPKLSIKLGKEFKVAPDYFMLLQASYDVYKAKEKLRTSAPDIKKFRKVIFWDTDIEKLNWHKSRRAIIKRVLERGNQQEVEELIAFYGKKVIADELGKIEGRTLPSLDKNIKEYNLLPL